MGSAGKGIGRSAKVRGPGGAETRWTRSLALAVFGLVERGLGAAT